MEMEMPNAPENEAEQLSALVDGELDPTGVARACGRWHAGSASHTTWHAYQLIGDVLRSEDLAAEPARELAFFAALRARLVDEPVFLAPSRPWVRVPDAVRSGRRLLSARWISAVAAGFAVVAGVGFLLHAPTPPDAYPAPKTLAQEMAPGNSLVTRVEQGTYRVDQGAQTLVIDGRLVRDSRLDHYLAAHKQFAGSSALGVPSAFLRGATSDASSR
jgi:sigma-E factor negative regulatory protein RseA